MLNYFYYPLGDSNIMNKYLFFVLIIFFSNTAFSLVNYSKKSSAGISKQGLVKTQSRASSRRSHPSIFFDIGKETVSNRSLSEKFDLYKLHLGTFVIPGIGLYFKTEFGGEQSEESSLSLGNSEIISIIDWMGSHKDGARLSVIAGAIFSGGDDAIGHDRSDQVLGLMTSKSFGRLVSTASFSHYFLGETDQTSLEAMNKVGLKFSYVFQANVKMGMDVNFYNTTGLIKSGDDFSFVEYSPSMSVGLSSFTNLKIGAKYSSRKADVSSLSSFSQWDLGSCVGNSIYASLGFSI